MSDDTASLSLGRETFVGLFAKFTLAVIGFAGVVFFYRELGPAVIGVYYTILAAGKILSQIPGGVSSAVQKRVSEVDTANSSYLGVGILITGSLLVLAVLAGPGLQSVWSRFGVPVLHVAGIVAVFGSLAMFSLANRFYAGIGNPGASFWTDTVRSVFTLGFQVLLIVMGYQVGGLLGGFVLATAGTAIGVAVLAGVIPSVPTRESVHRTVQFAKWSVPNALTSNLYARLDVLVLAWFVGTDAVGIYEPALRLTIPATFIAISVGDTLVVKSSGLHSLGEDVFDDLQNAASYACLLAFPIFFGALAIPEKLMVTVYGPSAIVGSAAVVGLALFQVFNAYRVPFDKVVNGLNRPEIQLYVSAVTLVINIGLAIPLAIRYGLIGVVAATIVAEALRLVIYQFVSRHVFDSLVLPRPLLYQLVSGVVMFVVVEGASTVIPVRSWVWLGVLLAIGAIAYFGVLALVSSHFRLTVGNVLKSIGVGRLRGWV